MEADPTELESAILNLAVNARDAMPEGGKLTIEASNSYLDEAYCARHPDIQPGQYVQLAVTDTGSGMSKDVVDRAFEPFFTTKASGHGTGLGLSQVYGFVKQSGGHVKIYSEVGEGSTVKIYLRRFAGKAAAPEEPRPEKAPGRSGECILVVEDDADVRTYVTETLASLGYDVLDAAGGDDALRLMDQHQAIVLLLTDVVMPGAMNGKALADAVAARWPTTSIVFMSGYTDNVLGNAGGNDGNVRLLNKPFRKSDLAQMLRQTLDEKG